MGKYFIYAGLIGKGLENKGVFDFESDEVADEFAYSLAKKLYFDDPLRTIEDIMFEDSVGLEEASRIFEIEMEDAIDFFSDPMEEEEDFDAGVIWYEGRSEGKSEEII